MSEILIYRGSGDLAQVEVRFDRETVWLNQSQLAEVFDTDRTSILKHLQNIFASGELEEKATCANFAQVRQEGRRTVSRQVVHYNLDAILSVGYRVNSKRGTQFRQWATARLRDYLVTGYAMNEKRLAERDLELKHLRNGIHILRRSIETEAHDLVEAGRLASLLDQFSQGLTLLDDYDHETLDSTGKTERPAVVIEPDEYRALVAAMKSEFASAVFGQEKDAGFDASVRQVYQTFGGRELYPSLEDKAATLLYLVVKNHSFADGNKRIAAACFLYFLERNQLLTTPAGEPLLSDDALAAVTLFIAVSRPDEMATVKQVVISMLNRKE